MIFTREIASIGAAMLIGLSATSARAGYVVDLTQQGSDVVASGSGAIDLTGLSFNGGIINDLADIVPSFGTIHTGPTFPVEADVYTGITTGPTSFGSGGESFPSSGSGDFVGVEQGFFLIVPMGYVSDSQLSDTSTYLSQTFSSLGATPGTYKWTWGVGANQNFTLVIGTAVPEPSTWAMLLLGFAGLGFIGYRSARWRRATVHPA